MNYCSSDTADFLVLEGTGTSNDEEQLSTIKLYNNFSSIVYVLADIL